MAKLNSFKIARYILFALVLVLCVWILIWIFVSGDDKNMASQKPIKSGDIQITKVTTTQNNS